MITYLKNIDKEIIFIFIIASVLFLPFLGSVHLFDWDEVNFAEAAREMMVTGNYSMVQINFQPFWEKPPLFFWLQVLSMKLFGITEFAARFPNAVCGIITLLVLYSLGKKLHNKKLGLIWTIVYGASFLPHFYFKSGIIDPWFNLFIFLGIYQWMSLHINSKKKLLRSTLSGVFIGLAIMTKGPVALLIFGLVYGVYVILKKFKSFIKFKYLITFTAGLLVTGSLWFITEYINGRGYIIYDFINYQLKLLQTPDAGHKGFFLYHFVVLLFGCFPASLFFIRSFKKLEIDNEKIRVMSFWMKISFWVVVILFTLVTTKIVHYSSLAYFPITFLASVAIYQLLEKRWVISSWLKAAFIFVGSIIGLVITIIPLVDYFKKPLIEKDLIKDSFAKANLEALVNWNGFEFLIGVFFIVGVIVGVYFLSKKTKNGIAILFIVSTLTIHTVTQFIVPKVEKYSQGAAIDFYKSKSGEDCYILTLGFKSYAHFYYADKKPQKNPNYTNQEWLLFGAIDKVTYIVTKNTYTKTIKERYPHLKKINEKNGFVFYERNPELEF